MILQLFTIFVNSTTTYLLKSPGEGREGARPADEGDGGRGWGRQGGQSQGDQQHIDREKCYLDNDCLDAFVKYWGDMSQGDQHRRDQK